MRIEITEGSVQFIAEDGRTMFDVRPQDDGRSIEIRGVTLCRVAGVLYSSTLELRPVVANVVIVRARQYDD